MSPFKYTNPDASPGTAQNACFLGSKMTSPCRSRDTDSSPATHTSINGDRPIKFFSACSRKSRPRSGPARHTSHPTTGSFFDPDASCPTRRVAPGFGSGGGGGSGGCAGRCGVGRGGGGGGGPATAPGKGGGPAGRVLSPPSTSTGSAHHGQLACFVGS